MTMPLRLTGVLVALMLTAPGSATPASSRARGLPQRMLWAWERPEDLRSVGDDVGVAFLAQTIHVDGPRIAIAPRRQPLRVRPATRVVAVTRIESDPRQPIDSRVVDLEALAGSIAKTARLARVQGVQIDFDARASERPAYRDLLRAVRRRLDPQLPLSITALASWCADDTWLRDLPIDEAVPMLFRMGPEDAPFRRRAADNRWSEPMCRGAFGVSLDEPAPGSRGSRRAYVFNPKPWTSAAIDYAGGMMR